MCIRDSYITSIATFLLNLGIVITPFIYGLTVFINSWFLNIIFIKFIAEYILLTKGGNSFSRQFLILNFLQWFIIQPIYIVVVSVFSILNINPKWQGRQS